MPSSLQPQAPPLIQPNKEKVIWAFQVWPNENIYKLHKSHGNIDYIEFDDVPTDGFQGKCSLLENFFQQQ